MKFHLQLSENLLNQCKTGALKWYNWKGIYVNIEFCTILLLNANFQNCLILTSNLENVFFNNFLYVFVGESRYKIEYVY